MVKLSDLKLGMLLSLKESFTFSETYYSDDETYTAIYPHRFIPPNEPIKVVILIQKYNSYDKRSWYCFCDGKICIYDILDSDLKKLDVNV